MSSLASLTAAMMNAAITSVDADRIVAFAGIRLVDRSPAWEQAGLFNQQSLSQATVPALWHPCDII
jgi:hypothetical protein